jgi:hypothetical protein
MSYILINGLKSGYGGGRTIFNNYMSALNNNITSTKNKYYILSPKYFDFSSNKKIILIKTPKILYYNIFAPILYFFYLPFILNKYKINYIFNLGDIILPYRCKQLYFFDWAYAIYDEDYIWKNMNTYDFIKRKIKVYLFKLFINPSQTILVQTNLIKQKFNLKNYKNKIIVFPTPVNFVTNGNYNFLDLDKEKYTYFFYPASYVSHKNFDIFDGLVKFIVSSNSLFKIILTLPPSDFILFSKNKTPIELDIFINIGYVSLDSIYSIYDQSDFLLFPSILESYGLPLIESMFLKTPILCSDLDYAKEICGTEAFYFNPFDCYSLFKLMDYVSSNKNIIKTTIDNGSCNYIPKNNWTDLIDLIENLSNNENE